MSRVGFALGLGTIGRYAIRYRRFYAVGAIALFLVNLCDVGLPLVLKMAIDDLALLHGTIPVGAIAAIYFGLVLLQGVYRYARRGRRRSYWGGRGSFIRCIGCSIRRP